MKNRTYKNMGRIVLLGGLILIGATHVIARVGFFERGFFNFLKILKAMDLLVFFAFSVMTTVLGFVMMCVHSGAKQKQQPYANDNVRRL